LTQAFLCDKISVFEVEACPLLTCMAIVPSGMWLFSARRKGTLFAQRVLQPAAFSFAEALL
jgi:hypothetical protein